MDNKLASKTELNDIENTAYTEAKNAQKEAYEDYISQLEKERNELIEIVTRKSCICNLVRQQSIEKIISELKNAHILNRKLILSSARKILRNYCVSCDKPGGLKNELKQWVADYTQQGWANYSENKLYNKTA